MILQEKKYWSPINEIKRRVRLVVLLDAAESAGLTPMPILRLHAYTYLANVLAKVWDLPSLDGKILKRRGGPFYPELQNDIDRLVGLGMFIVSNLSHVKDEDGKWRLEGSYILNRPLCEGLLQALGMFDDESRIKIFIKELAFSLSALDMKEFDRAILEDATYSDPLSGLNNVIDFAEWRNINFSSNAASHFSNYTTEGAMTSPGKKLHLYVRHLYRRAHAAG